jgi:uncharacterized protein YdhG (YjbR/CyaY superfamily)
MNASSKSQSFTPEERAAMKQRAKELKENASKAEALAAVLAKIAEMDAADRVLAERVHAIVTEVAPQLAPKLWYGSPAYARDGAVVCFFQESKKFNTRYATLGFSDSAKLDDGAFWPTSYALTKLAAADEKKLSALVKKAAS